MKIAAVIPARLDSTRLPNKLLRDICGKSLIIRTYQSTLNSVQGQLQILYIHQKGLKQSQKSMLKYFVKVRQQLLMILKN